MKQYLLEVKKLQKLAGILKESIAEVEKASEGDLRIIKQRSSEGNTQIILTVLGRGWDNNELVLSIPEAKKLVELAKSFSGQRKQVSDSIGNVTLQIDEDGENCEIGRMEDSGGSKIYKGYDEESGSSTGRLIAPQSIVYQIVDELPKKI